MSERAARETGGPAGRYLLRELIARGGMGEVFRAIAVGAGGFEKPVVVKRILPAIAGSDAAARFADEAKRMSRLVHPNIVQVIDFGRGELDDYFLVMELVDGLDVGAFVRAHGDRRVPIGIALFIVSQMLRGLGHAHTQAYDDGRTLVHRDVSPGNVLLSRVGEVKLADFGVAIANRPGEPWEETSRVGKPSYMAPEQWRGDPLDARADLFATGVVLFQLLTGELPFAGSTAEARQEQAQAGQVRSALALRPEIGEALDVMIAQSLATDPGGRFASARAMRRALEAASPQPLASSDELADAVQASTQRAPHGKRVITLGIAPAPDTRLGELTRVDATGTFSLVVDNAPTVPDRPVPQLAPARRPRRLAWLTALPLAIGAAAVWLELRREPMIAHQVPATNVTVDTTAKASSAPERPSASPPPRPSVAPPLATTEPRVRPLPTASAIATCSGEVILSARGSWDITGGPRSVQAPHRDTWPCGTYSLTGTSRQNGRTVARTLVVREGTPSSTRFE